MPKIGLALSGGGFRAMLYHLGVIRFLKDADILKNVTNIGSVSGGSILAAHLTLNWERYNGDDANFADVAREIIRFAQFDLRNHIVRRIPLLMPLRLLAKLPFLDERWFTSNALLENYYEKFLYGDRCLYELPKHPNLHILATCVSTGELSAFNRDGLFIHQRSEVKEGSFIHIPGQLASIPRVVGASSAFPGFFPPVLITAADLGVREGQFSNEYFTDGGVYDNLGLRAFLWLLQQNVTFDHILISDAGKPFQILSKGAPLGIIGQSLRASDILWDRVWQLERENFCHHERFLFLPITELVSQTDNPAALHPVVQAEVQSIRTDLDRFSKKEINALAQHGYEVARKLCLQHNLLEDSKLLNTPPWKPITTKEIKKVFLSSSTAPETQWARQLRKSSYRRIMSTFFDWRDWPSYIYLAIAFVLFFYLPFEGYKFYKKSQTQAQVLASISSGDPDVKQILALATSDPTKGWVNEEVQEKTEPVTPDFAGIEILTHSRFYDLRRWVPDQNSSDQKGQVYIRDRITLKFLESYKGDGIVTFSAPINLENVAFRQPKDVKYKGTISKISQPVEILGKEQTLYEFTYNLENVLPEEPVTIELELVGDSPKRMSIPFVIHAKTDLISVWILFPPNHPYKTYSLRSYPIDKSAPPRIMKNRYTIDHPYGYLIGWSVVNPEENRVYECSWTYESEDK